MTKCQTGVIMSLKYIFSVKSLQEQIKTQNVKTQLGEEIKKKESFSFSTRFSKKKRQIFRH